MLNCFTTTLQFTSAGWMEVCYIRLNVSLSLSLSHPFALFKWKIRGNYLYEQAIEYTKLRYEYKDRRPCSVFCALIDENNKWENAQTNATHIQYENTFCMIANKIENIRRKHNRILTAVCNIFLASFSFFLSFFFSFFGFLFSKNLSTDYLNSDCNRIKTKISPFSIKASIK